MDYYVRWTDPDGRVLSVPLFKAVQRIIDYNLRRETLPFMYIHHEEKCSHWTLGTCDCKHRSDLSANK